VRRYKGMVRANDNGMLHAQCALELRSADVWVFVHIPSALKVVTHHSMVESIGIVSFSGKYLATKIII
jgi:hypothetical protein